MFNQKRKRNQFVLTTFVLVIAVVLLGFLLVRSISSLVARVTNSDTTAVEVAQLPFDYTRDRDQYWQPVVTVPMEGFQPKWEAARQQYELSVKGLVPGWDAAVAPFDYTRDPQFEHLVLNSLYTQWCHEIADNMTVDALCITPHGSETAFITDENGNGSITLETSALQSDGFFEVAIAYQSGGQSVADRMPIWFDFLPTNNVIAAVEPTNMFANHNDNIVASGTSQRQSLSTTGSGRYTVDGNQATLELVFDRLVPDAEYTLWCVAITASTNQQITESPCT